MKRIGWLALLALGAAGTVSAAEFSFGPPLWLVTARDTYAAVAIGDANGDGRGDLAATGWPSDSGAARLSLFLQRPDGSLAPPVHADLPEYTSVRALAFVDLDHNAAREIVVGYESGGPILVRLEASGALSTPAPTAGRGCEFLASGDADGDGHTDIACHDWKETASVHFGNGSGGFREPLVLKTPAAGGLDVWKTVRLADVTGDGRADLLVTSGNVPDFFVFPNDAKGGFWPATVYPHPRSFARAGAPALEVMDLDGDGANEVITASPGNTPNATLNVFRRGANGYLALAQRIPVTSAPTAMLAADVDGSGDNDLLVGHFAFNSVTALGLGAPGLTGQARYGLPGFGFDIADEWSSTGHSNSLALGDLNGDGCKDLAAATRSGLKLLSGCRAPAKPRIAAANDFDGDGVGDLLMRSEWAENYMWGWADVMAWHACVTIRNYRTGQAACPNILGVEWDPVAFGDFDGDSASDILWRNGTTGENQIWDRALYPRAIGSVPSLDWKVVGAGDFDGDLRADLLWRNSRTGANTIWKSASQATYQVLPVVSDQSWKVAGVGDFDGDGRADILWRNAVTGGNDLWPSARRELRQALASVTNPQWKVAGVGDFNGDGKDDIAWRNDTTGASDLWHSASLAQRRALTAMSAPWTLATVGDYNGDGRADVFWHNATTGVNVIWRSGDSKQPQAVEESGTSRRVVR